MRNKVLEFLKNKSGTKIQQYNTAFDLYRKTDHPSSAIIRSCNLGYTEKNLENLIYELQKVYGITQSEILSKLNRVKTDKPLYPGVDNDVNPIGLQELEEHKKIKDEFPFLRKKDCPNEFKILINDKLTAFDSFCKAHKELTDKYFSGEITENTNVEELEELQDLIKESVTNFHLNRDIYAELDYYKEKGEILGKHPILADLLSEQNINKLTAVELVKRVNNLKNYIQNRGIKELEKATTEEEKQKITERINAWEKEKKYIEEKINAEKK